MKDLVYYITPDKHDAKSITEILKAHPEIEFVSLMGIDLGGNSTDEKIPVKLFMEDIDGFLKYGVQTDGSSVVLQGIATLNNARLDILPDLDVNWFVDYNYDYLSEENGLPVGTLRIPSFLVHNNKRVDSRSILKRAVEHFENGIMNLIKNNDNLVADLGLESADEVDSVVLTSATELEFWVKTPDDKADIEKLSTSQTLKEQYWKRTQGSVRTALEQCIKAMEHYGLEPEMGHKEVGGAASTIGVSGRVSHVMEQLEIDWKYSTALQTADNEILARELVGDIFRKHELEVTFAAKPIEGVAGSGEHTHMGVALKLKNGKVKNLFSPKNMKDDYLSIAGYGALMGLLKNYEVVGPFVTSSNDAFNRLKPGFEAPVCIVASLGHDVDTPTRNRSILVGLIRDMDNPYATRFELRAPNPMSNTYLVLASSYQSMLDGIRGAVNSKKTSKDLCKEISKDAGVESFYLEKDRAYRSEEDVFEHYNEDERNSLFGKPPATVWENIKNFDIHRDKSEVLLSGDVFTTAIIESFKMALVSQWVTEIENRLIPNNIQLVRECKKVHNGDSTTDLDTFNWQRINNLRLYLIKDSIDNKSLFTRLREALDNREYDLASVLQIEMNEKMKTLRELYIRYKRNLFEA